MRAPKDDVVKFVIIKVDKLTNKICPRVKVPRDPLRIQRYTKLKTNVEGLEGEQLKVGLPAAVKENGGNILVVRILYDFRAREEAYSLEFPPR